MTVVRRGLDLLVAEQDLNHPDIDPLLKQVCGERVSQTVQVHRFVEASHCDAGMERPVELAGRQGIDRVLPREQPAAFKHFVFCLCEAPPLTQYVEQHGREHCVAILAALALLDMNQHPSAVDIVDPEVGDFTGAQAGAVGCGQCGFVFEVGGCLKQALHLFRAQDHRQLAGFVHGTHFAQYLRVTQGVLEEKPQPADGGIDGLAGNATGGQVQLKLPQVLGRGRVRRPAKKPGKFYHGAKVGGFGSLDSISVAPYRRSCAGAKG